jgi:hypothetical protein
VDIQALTGKIQALPPERITDVANFVDFIAARERESLFIRAATAVSAPAFAVVWNSPDDDVYDAL